MNPNFLSKDNAYLIEKYDAKLSSSVLAAINTNTTFLARGESITTDYKNAILFSFKMAMFHRYPIQHFQIIAVSLIMSVILSLILSKLFI